VATAGGGPVVALIGDVAFAHDLSGLLAAVRLDLELTVVVINNEGAAVFDYLPIAAERDVYERHIATAPGLELERAAALYGLRYERPRSLAALRELIRAPQGRKLIEVASDRAAGVDLHARVWTAVSRSLTAAR
jgi:2-succinyl-5-enolpyruvyl-6-hydroxy-3-cyclohexene-1-carboxylate synthase